MNSSANKCPELLAPAGSMESLRAAVNAGADAVYTGGSMFGARAYAENADTPALLEGIRYAHLHGVHVHLTVNTLMKDRELSLLPAYLSPYYEAGLDAAIVQDIGAFSLLHRQFPLLPLHASTQTTVTGPYSGLFWKQLGAVRLIPARELSLEELKEVKRVTGIEIETFVHGALCYSYSGQCLMSSLIGGRSGNRGRCAQTCRLPYALQKDGRRMNRKGEAYLLSCRDLCSLDLIPVLAEAGIDSFKIEGRMKGPRYTAGVVEIWRRYLDRYAAEGPEGYHVEDRDRRQLLDLFDRGGQTPGYFFQHNGSDMLALSGKPEFREENAALSERLDQSYLREEKQISIRGNAVFAAGQPMRFRLSCRGAEAEAVGKCPERANTCGATEAEVRTRMMKMGGTPFHLEHLELSLSEGLFLPVGQLNALRRDAVASLEQALCSRFHREQVDPKTHNDRDREKDVFPLPAEKKGEIRFLHVSCESEAQIAAALSCPEVTELSFDADCIPAKDWKKWATEIRESGKKVYIGTPQIFRAEAARFFSRHAETLIDTEADSLVMRSLEAPGFFRALYEAHGKPLPPFCFDYQVYGMNREARRVLTACGAFRLTLPVELNRAELSELGCSGSELVAAGRLSMMVTAQCLKKTVSGCDGVPALFMLRDRRGMDMPVKNRCSFCFNQIFNALPLSLVGMREQVKELGPESIRVLLTTENEAESRKVIQQCAASFLRGERVSEPYEHFTRGHMKRGVQ